MDAEGLGSLFAEAEGAASVTLARRPSGSGLLCRVTLPILREPHTDVVVGPREKHHGSL